MKCNYAFNIGKNFCPKTNRTSGLIHLNRVPGQFLFICHFLADMGWRLIFRCLERELEYIRDSMKSITTTIVEALAVTVVIGCITPFLLIFAVPVMAGEADTGLTLKQCLEIGLKKSHSIVRANLEQTRARYQKQEAASRFYPQIEGYSTYDNYLAKPVTKIPGEIFGQSGTMEISMTSEHNMAVGVKATQLLYNRTASTSVDLSEKAQEVSAVNLEKTAGDVIYEIAARYFRIQAVARHQAVVRENMARYDRLLSLARAQHDMGVIGTVDVQRIRANRENLATELRRIDIRYAQQLELLKYAIGIEKEKQIDLIDVLDRPLWSGDLPDVADNTGRPELQLLAKQREMALLNKELARSGNYPTLSLYAQYYYLAESDSTDFLGSDTDAWNDVSAIGLRFSIPLFDGFGKRSKIDQANADYILATHNYDYMRRYYGVEYENAVKQYTSNKNSERRQYENVQLAKAIYDQMLLHYQQGIAPLSDLLKVENSLNEANLDLFDTILQLRLSELDILKSSGTLKSILNQ